MPGKNIFNLNVAIEILNIVINITFFSLFPGLYYNPTSILFLNVPSISKLQWHPFTVTSNCNMEQDKLSVVVKRQGSWTQKLCQEIASSVDHLEVSVEGPYGPTSSHFLRLISKKGKETLNLEICIGLIWYHAHHQV